MRFSLRTLLVVMLLAGPLGAYGWSRWCAYREWQAFQAAQRSQGLRLSPVTRAAPAAPGQPIVFSNVMELTDDQLEAIREYDARMAREREELLSLVKRLNADPLPGEHEVVP